MSQKEQSQIKHDYNSKIIPQMDIREQSYAGLWYSKYEQELTLQLNVWLEMAKCEITGIKSVKAILAPHSGFSFSGPTAAWAYKYLKLNYNTQSSQTKKLRVFVLGPFHHIFIRACGLSGMNAYETPLGNIEIDQETIQELRKEGSFEITDKDAEEEEHSIEMQLCFLIKCLGLENIKLVPLMIGAIDFAQEDYYGKILSKYINMDDTLFILSTDFCHWGNKYKYNFTPNNGKEDGEIYEQIEKLDQRGMEFIEMNDIEGFRQYMRDTENTICGNHAISILMSAFSQSIYSQHLDTKFIRYSQSSLVRDKNDSSVSYAAAITFLSAD